jgi:type I restriction enzyme R subunit
MLPDEDREITASNLRYFGEPVYEYTLIQAQEDGYLAACEIVKRKASIDSRVFTKEEILKAGVKDIRTGKLLTEVDLTKDQYTGKDFDDELFIELRTPAMCEDLFQLLCQNGGPEQKVIIFCNREIHADRVVQRMNNLYVKWCKKTGQEPKDHYAFKCMAGPNNGSDMIEPMRGSSERAFIACTVDLLEAGVDIERLNAVVFFRYLQSSIKFYQMVGRGTRIHEETQKYKFWLYDYTDVTSLFGTEFITRAPRPSGFILCRRDGRDTPIPVDEYRREIVQRVISEAHSLNDFRALWIETQKRRRFIEHLLGDNFSPEVIREIDQMNDFDLYDFFGHHSYHARALKRAERGELYLSQHQDWFRGMDTKAAIVLKGFGQQFAQGGTDALETSTLWEVPEIRSAGGLDALRILGVPAQVMFEAKRRLFGV